MANPNPYIDYPVGTCFKEVYDGITYFYLLGEYYLYRNSFEDPELRPWKVDMTDFSIASEDEKKQFIEDLKKNNLIWDEETGHLSKMFEEVTLKVKVKVKPGTDLQKLVEILNKMNYRSYPFCDTLKFEKM